MPCLAQYGLLKAENSDFILTGHKDRRKETHHAQRPV